MPTRREHDALGEVLVPADRLWGAQTQRSLDNFPIGQPNFRWGRAVIRALGLVKGAAARANAALGEVPAERAALIEQAAREVAEGRWDAEFPLVVFQTGSGTQTNMNANEVIANRANQLAGGALGSGHPVHPNDDVNRGQSSNDVFPAVMHLALVASTGPLLASLDRLRATFSAKSADYREVVMLGRTHLQDATPVALGQVIGGWNAQLGDARRGIEAARDGLFPLALGGTAVGTGINTHPRFGAVAAAELAAATGAPFREAEDKFSALSAHDAVVAFSAALRTLAGAAMKIANDVRWYCSGPRAGIGELRIPDNEPGSSIMPGKINPTQCEALTQVAVRVFGNDAAVAFAGTQGSFQLNTYKPVMLHAALESAELLAEAIASFDRRCAAGIEPERERIARHLADSLMLVTALSPHVGYEAAAKVALEAHRRGIGLREAAVELGVASAEDFDRWVVPSAMVGR